MSQEKEAGQQRKQANMEVYDGFHYTHSIYRQKLINFHEKTGENEECEMDTSILILLNLQLVNMFV